MTWHDYGWLLNSSLTEEFSLTHATLTQTSQKKKKTSHIILKVNWSQLPQIYNGIKFINKRKILSPNFKKPKGQLNSEWIYKVIVSPKMPTKKFSDFGGLLEGRVEIWQTFGWHFWRNDDLINSFWIYLTFRKGVLLNLPYWAFKVQDFIDNQKQITVVWHPVCCLLVKKLTQMDFGEKIGGKCSKCPAHNIFW